MIGATLGGFQILHEIGRGGMAVVYRARQIALNRDVAVKVLPPELARHNPALSERFLHEAGSMARLSHPNIADVIDYGEQDGVQWFAMKLVEGEALDSLLARVGRLSPEQAAEIAAQVADALQHAHERGVIHRDVKPGNILIDQSGKTVVTDFGIAKAADVGHLTVTGASIGTPEYMSPEQAKGEPIDGRSDIYSLGAVLYAMICGEAPFTATTPVAVAMKHVNEPPRDPRELAPGCPEPVAGTIARALAKHPAYRFSTAQEMAAALRGRGAWQAPATPGAPARQRSRSATPIAAAILVVGILAAALMLGAALLMAMRRAGLESAGPGSNREVRADVETGDAVERADADGGPGGAAGSDRDASAASTAREPGVYGRSSGDAESATGDRDRRVGTNESTERRVEQVKSLIESWRDAWVRHDLDELVACFWPGAIVDGVHASELRGYHSKQFERHPAMEISITEPRVRLKGNSAEATFTQHYRGWGPELGYESEGVVTFVLENRDGEWRIAHETFEKLWCRRE